MIVYDIDKFDVNKHLTYDILTKEMKDEQYLHRYRQHRTGIKLKENFNYNYNPYTINILCKPFKISKGIHIFEFNRKTESYFNGMFDPKRFQVNFYTNTQNCISNLYKQLDKYFSSDEFKFNYFKEIEYNQETKNKFKFTMYPLYIHDEDEDDGHRHRNYKLDRYKLKFGVNKNNEIITTKIIIKDNKSNRMKEYENLKFKDFNKIEKLMKSKNITIQPLINLYNIYCNPIYKRQNYTIIQYGILLKMKELTIYTDDFDYIITNIFEDNIKNVQFYYNNKLINDMKKEISKNNEEKIKEIEYKIDKKQTTINSNFSNNLLKINIFIFILLLNNIFLFYYFKKL